ncbi:MAG TPA: sigma-70 family RNA polymerase sigma factor [Mobilitalea sp.]|nr:sigma-70 family RNA polymerase sigma factor [Mobilitalea sp.]
MKDLNTTIYDKLVEHILENQNKFYRIAYCYVYQKEAALDIIQNAICRALENYPGLKNTNAIKTWFYRILINECLQYLNKCKREVPCEPSELKEDVYYEEAYEPKLEVYQKVCELPEQLKTIVILHYFEQMTLKEISQTIDVNLSTVKTRLYTALQRLKKEMEVEE